MVKLCGMIRRVVLCACLCLLTTASLAQPLSRVANTTLQFPQTPGGFGYRLVDVLGLAFEQPVAIATPPGETNRLFVVEQPGRIVVITNLAAPTRTVFLDLFNVTIRGGEQGLLGLAFHPRFAENGRFFVFRTVTASTAGNPNRRHNRLSEYRVSPTDPNRAALSELILFQQNDEASNHNGGDLHFGPDGHLYVALGDEGGGNDQYGNSQLIDRDFFAGLLRLDVDQRPGSLVPNPHPAVVGNYWIPADNPYVGATGFLNRQVNPASVRTEFFAVGLRNPWRFSFDSATGELWIADVGQNQREMIYVSRQGANHGWAFREANITGPKSGAPAGFTTNPAYHYVPPVHTYAHGSGPTQGNSVTGGLVYRGTRLSQLHGAYVFADYASGNVWALRRRDGAAPLVTRLLGKGGIAGFGADPRNLDILVCDHSGGRIQRLDYTETFVGTPLPATLAETGALEDLEALTPAPGFVPYTVNQSFWSDDAVKRRWFCVPDTNAFVTFTTNDAWGAPAGTVWMKHFDLELTNGVPESRRRLETRFLVRNPAGVYGVTYRWDSAANATLVPEEGADEEIVRVVNDQPVRQTWRYPSRAECLVCHTPQAGHALSFNTAQLNLEHDYATERTNQLAALLGAGYFSNPPASLVPLPALAHPTNELASLEWRARSYLAVNCAPCHRPGGTGGGQFDARLETPTFLTRLVNGPLNDSHGDAANRVIVPGDPAHSVLLQRLSVRGPAQMPPLASNTVDEAGAELLGDWIATMPLGTSQDVPATLETELTPAGLRLRVRQPANHAIQLEMTTELAAAVWHPVPTPGTEPTFPAVERVVTLEPPPAGETVFYRVVTRTP